MRYHAELNNAFIRTTRARAKKWGDLKKKEKIEDGEAGYSRRRTKKK